LSGSIRDFQQTHRKRFTRLESSSSPKEADCICVLCADFQIREVCSIKCSPSHEIVNMSSGYKETKKFTYITRGERHPAVFGPMKRKVGVNYVQRKIGCLPRGGVLGIDLGVVQSNGVRWLDLSCSCTGS